MDPSIYIDYRYLWDLYDKNVLLDTIDVEGFGKSTVNRRKVQISTPKDFRKPITNKIEDTLGALPRIRRLHSFSPSSVLPIKTTNTLRRTLSSEQLKRTLSTDNIQDQVRQLSRHMRSLSKPLLLSDVKPKTVHFKAVLKNKFFSWLPIYKGRVFKKSWQIFLNGDTDLYLLLLMLTFFLKHCDGLDFTNMDLTSH